MICIKLFNCFGAHAVVIRQEKKVYFCLLNKVLFRIFNMKKSVLFLTLVGALMQVGWAQQRDTQTVRCFDAAPGDLLFFRDTEGMGAAVKESTGQYTHVALVESVGDTVWIIDATPEHGVSRRPYLHFYNDKTSAPDIFRPEFSIFDLDSVLIRARSFVGQPYDNAFLPDNGALYCSELIYECFLDDDSYESGSDRHLFKAAPMNWRDADGNLPQYWVKHFKKLKMPVPEGVMGTNPTDLSRSSLLRKL